jgi:hypothetical protein
LAFRALAGRAALPRLRVQPGFGDVDAFTGRGDLGVLVAGHREHVADAAVLQLRAQAWVATVALVAGDEPDRDPGVERRGDHLQGEGGLGGELDAVGDARDLAAVAVVDPGLRQVDPPVDQRPPVRGRVRQEHSDLAVLDPPSRPAILTLHRDRAGALLEESGLVHDQNRVRMPKVLHDQIAQLVTDRIGIPHDVTQQPLHPRRAAMPGMLGQPPTVLTLQRRQQPDQEVTCRQPRLDSREARRDPLDRLLEHPPPARHGYAVVGSHRPRYWFVHNRQ